MRFKKLFFIPAILGTLLLSSASCSSSDDNDDPKTLAVADLSKSYTVNNMTIKLDDVPVGETAAIDIVVESADNVTFTLKNIINNEPSVTLKGKVVDGGLNKFTFELTDETGNRVILFTGFFFGTSNADVMLDAEVKLTKLLVAESLPGKYESEGTKKLTVNNNNTLLDMSVELSAITGTKGTITLNNFLIEEAKIEQEITLTKNNTNGFEFELIANDADKDFSVKGIFSQMNDGTVQLDVTKTLNYKTEILGKWALTVNNKTALADFFFNIEFDGWDETKKIIEPLVGKALAGAIAKVEVEFIADGNLNIGFVLPEDTIAPTNRNSEMTTLPFNYYIKEQKLHLAISEEYIKMAGSIQGMEGLINILETILSAKDLDGKPLIIQENNYYVIQLGSDVKDTNARFFAEKALVGGILRIPTLGALIPDNMLPIGGFIDKEILLDLISQISEVVDAAKGVELGLGFTQVK